MVRLILARHAETVWNAAGRIQGQADPPLSPRGRAQVEALRRRVAGVAVARVFTSDLRRARETAAAFAAEATPLPELREAAVGAWEGTTRAELRARWPVEYAAYLARPSWDLVPGGETVADFAARIRRGLELALAGAAEGDTVVAVTHIGVIRLVLSEVFALPVAEQRWPWTVENTSLTTLLTPSHGWCPAEVEVLAVNDAAHLDTLA